jgi:hypothetical protein
MLKTLFCSIFFPTTATYLVAGIFLNSVSAQQTTVANLPNGTHRLCFIFADVQSCFNFRKSGNRVVGIFTTQGQADPPEGLDYWERQCVEGTVKGNIITGTAIDVKAAKQSAKIASKSPDIQLGARSQTNSEQLLYTFRLTQGRVVVVRPAKTVRGVYAVVSRYQNASLDLKSYKRTNPNSAAPAKTVPSSCAALQQNPFNQSFDASQ